MSLERLGEDRGGPVSSEGQWQEVAVVVGFLEEALLGLSLPEQKLASKYRSRATDCQNFRSFQVVEEKDRCGG